MSRSFFTEKPLQFEVLSLQSFDKVSMAHIQESERLPMYEINWFKSGKGTISIDSQQYQVRSDLVFCLAPGQTRHCHVHDQVEGYRISFSRDFLCVGACNIRAIPWLESFEAGNPAIINADAEFQYELEEILVKMQREFTNYYLLRSEILSGMLNILVIHFSRKVQLSPGDFLNSKDKELVGRFKSLLKQFYITKKLVSDYAYDLCVTPNYLNRTVKKITGFTASHHIQQHIILEAKRKALHTNISMKEIAYSLGFDNLAHFSKFFKSNCGMNFTNFKKASQAA